MAANPIGSMAAVNDQLLKLALMGYGYDPEALDVLGAGTDQPGEMLTRLITEWYFWIPSIRLAEALSRRVTQAYLYEFAWRTTIFDGKMGAGHYLEVPFVFDTLGVETEALLGCGAVRQRHLGLRRDERAQIVCEVLRQFPMQRTRRQGVATSALGM